MLTDIFEVKRKFCNACNCIYSNLHNQTELLQLQLQESYSLQAVTGVLQSANIYLLYSCCLSLM